MSKLNLQTETEVASLEGYLQSKMVEETKKLMAENLAFETALTKDGVSDEQHDLFLGMIDKNIGMAQAYRRVEDYIRQYNATKGSK